MPRAFAGARARILADGREIGWAQGVNGQENIALQRIDVLGNIDSEEIEAIGRTVSFSCDFVRILDQSLADMGIWPRGGTEIVINFPELTFEVFDHVANNGEGQTRWKIEGAKCESRSWRVDRTGVMTTNATWQARRLYDEAGVV